MIKKKYLKSMVALVLAGTLTMQSAAVYAMDFDDGSAGVQMEEDASVLEFQDDTDQVMDIAVDEGQPDDTAGVDFSSGAEIEEVPAVGEVSGDFNYEELNGSFVKITEYIGSDQEITIPKEINGFTVQQIGDNAFENSEIISVTIPDTVTSIGKAAFKNSKSLANVKLGSKVKEIGESAFCGCVSLVEISVPASVENIGIQAFQDCTSLETATLVKGLKKIDSYAFSGCTALPTVEIPDSVTAIGYRVFYNCTGITTMSYPVGWTECAGYSSYPTYYGHIFEGCTGLTGITVPEGITELPKHAFEGCSELKEIILPSTLEKISESAFKGCTGIGTITVPDSVKKVELSAFEGCSALKEIILPEATVEIGAFAFSGCKGFTEITLPSTLGKIGYRAFYNCEGLEKINYPSSWTECTGYSSYPTLYGHIFEGCTNLAAIEVPEGVKKIPEHAFEGCSSVKTITLPESLEEIGGYAFDGCSSVKELEVPANVAKIGEYGLANNPGLTKVTFKGEKLEEIGAYAFTEDNGLKRVELPDSIKTMGYHVFYKCISLTNVNYPVNWTECSGYSSYPTRYGAVFEGCTKLIRITIPEGVRTIPRSAFEMWTGVERIALPDSVQTVEDYAFGGCSGLKRIYIGNNVSSIGDNSFKDHTADLTVYGEQGSYAETYAAAHNITFVEGDYRGGLSVISGTIEDEEGNGIEGVNVFVYDYTQNKTAGTYKTDTDGHWTCDDGNQGNAYRISYYHPSYRFTPGWSEVANAADKVTVDKVTGTLRGADSTEIGPEDVTYSVLNGSYISIDSYTGNAERIRIPEEINGYTVQKISNNAFKNNKNIQSVSLPESVETIGESAFENCGKLTEVVFPSGLESISIKAFQGCTGLTEVMLPNGLKKIDSYAFSGCTALPTVEIPDSVTAIGYRAFYNCTGITTMSYPVGWTECAGYSSYPTYYGHIFEGCTGLTGITVPEGITELPKHAFEGCSELKEIILPSTLEKISESAFKGCTGIGTITVPDNVKKVELSAFEGCSALKEIILPEATVEIGAFAFSGCKGFTEITLPSTLGKIGYRAFYNCEGLEKINYPSSWTECTGYSSYPTLYGHIFEGCTNLAAIEVPEGVKKIPEHAFEGCSSVKTITLPESLEEIGGYAFDGCSSVKELEVPANVAKIGEYGLANNPGLTKVTFKGEKLEEIGAYAFTEDNGLKRVELPDSIKTMGYHVFYKCISLTNVNYPVNWTECSGYSSYPTRYGAVFEGCTKLIRITIPEGVRTIPRSAFEMWTGVERIALPDSVQTVEDYAFGGCSGLKRIYIGNNVSSIGDNSFKDHTADLTVYGEQGSYAETYAAAHNITFVEGDYRGGLSVISGTIEDEEGNGIEGVNVFVYDYTQNKTAGTYKTDTDGHWTCDDGNQGNAYRISYYHPSYRFTPGWSEVANAADKVTVDKVTGTLRGADSTEIGPEDVTYSVLNGSYISIDSYTGNAERIRIPEEINGYTVQKISNNAFKNNKNIQSVSLPESVETIGESAFENCGKLTEVVFPSGLESISIKAFQGCTGLTEVMLPNGLKKIDSYAFSGCTALPTVEIPDSVTAIGYRAFYNCTGITTMSYPVGWTECAGYSSYPTYYGHIFEGCTGLTGITVPEGITELPKHAFEGCSELKEIILPSTLEKISESAFKGCTGIGTITVPDNVKKVELSAFEGCSALKEIILPEATVEIGAFAFSGCKGFTEITLPSTLGKIGYRAFYNCEGLEKINYPSSWTECTGYSSYPTLYGHIFEGCTNLAAIEVPEGVKKIPEHAFEGCSSVRTITLPESLEEIGGYAFDGCSSVKELEVPANVVKIGECGLARMIDLSDLTFKGEKLEEIGAYAFTEDSSLKNIELPDSIKAMGYRAFYKCAALESVNYPVNWTECSGYSSYPTRYGAVFEGCTKLIRITIPEGITVIADYAFEKADKLRYATFPSTLKMIGKEAFKDCAGLPYIDFPYELKTIGESAFEGCGGLINLEIPGSVSTVGKRAFYNNENLNTVQIQEGVQILSDEAFANNKELSEVYLPDSLTQLGKNVFANCPDVVIYCHNNTVASRYAISNELNIVFMEDDQQKTHEVLDDDDSWYTFSVDNAMSKGYIDGSVKYTVRENLFNEISDMSLKVKFPSNIKLDLTSVTLDGVETGYETVNNSLIVPVTKQSGVLKFTLTPETSKSYYTFAELDFTRNQTEQYEIIDTVSAKIPELTLKTNEITSTQNVVVSGVAPAGQTVNLSVDGQKIATTYARRSGNYSATITIPEAHSGEYYVIGAQATDKNNNSVETETGVSYLAERPSVTKFDMYYNNHQEAKLDLMQESLNGSAVSFNPAYPFMFVVGFDNVENVKKVQIKSTKKNEIVYMDTVYDEISKNYVASGFFDNRSGYVPGTLSITYQTKDNINYDIENQNDVDLLLRNVKKMYANTSEALTVKSQSHDVQTGMDTIVIEVGDTYQKYFGDNKELNLIGQIVKAEKDEATIKEIIDGYKIYDHYFDYTSDNYYLTVIDNWVQDPTSKNARSGLLILIGNSLDNTITKLAVVSDQGIDASDYFKGMSVVGKVAKSYGKILGNMNFAGEIRTKINSSDMTSSMKQKMLKDVNNYEVACNIYQGLTGLVGIGVTLWAGPTVKVAYYVVDYVAQDYFTQWKKAILEGNCGFGFADYMETVCIRIFSLGMEVYPTLCPFQAALFKWIIDPSGCVYVGSLSNPLKGAMVTLYYLNEETGKWEIWDASEYSQKNPITTGSDGVFAWDVPEGQWKVKVECKGYETMWSDVYTVPPEQTDINLNMQADQDVAIDSTYMTEGYVEITFTQLVLVDTLNTIQLTDEKGNNISYTVQNQNEVTDPDGKILVSSCRLVYDDSISPEQVNVQIMDGLTSYNGTKVKSQTVSVSNKGLPAVTLEDSKLELRSGDCILAKGKVENYSGQAKVEADTDAYSVAKIYRITQPDEDGQFEIYLDGINIGQTTLNITLTGTEISSQIAVTVGSTVDESKLVDKKHDHEYDDGVVVKEPTCGENGIKRYTCTTCQETKNETIPATGRHSYGEGVIRTNATCVKDGLKQYTCQACGMIRDETIPATGKHNFGKYSITKAATVLAKGTKTRTCKVCGEKENISIPKLTPILKVNASSVVLKIRQSTNGLKVTYGDGDRIISWNSSNTKIVKVSAQGKLTAQKKTGTAKVTVRLKSGLSKQISVRVQKDAVRTTKITGLPEKLTLKKGQKRTLNPVLMPFTSVEKVTYQSSDKKIVSVTSKGVIKGVKKGKSRITVKAGKKKYVVTVTVK